MRKILILLGLLLTLGLSGQRLTPGIVASQSVTVSSSAASYTDDFQSYSAGTLAGQGNWVLGINDIYVFANGSARGVGGNYSGLSCAIYNDTFADDQYSELKIITTPSYANNGVGVRLTGSGNTLCGYMYVKSGSQGYFMRITNGAVAGTYYNSTTTVSNNDVVRIEAIGDVISVYINGALDTGINGTGHVTDATYSSGRAGIISDGDENGGYCDDWAGGDL